MHGQPGAAPYAAPSAEDWHAQPAGIDLLLDRALIRRHFPYVADDTVALLHARRCGWLSGQQLGMHLLELARRAADGGDVALAGGANVAQQYLNAGLVDEMDIHLVPTLLGGGERLFDGVEDLKDLRLVRTVAAPDVTHLRFTRS